MLIVVGLAVLSFAALVGSRVLPVLRARGGRAKAVADRIGCVVAGHVWVRQWAVRQETCRNCTAWRWLR